jgi:hypothetical protein
MWALYCLVMLYHAFKDELHPIRPLSKFICIKAVVFLTFWQGLSLNVLVAVGAIKVRGVFGVRGGGEGQTPAVASQLGPDACLAARAGCLHHCSTPPPSHQQVNEQFTTYTATDVAEGLQDFLICIEMFLAALAHAYAFPPRVGVRRSWKGGEGGCWLQQDRA